MTELPEDDRYGTIMTCIDQFSKIVVLVPLHEIDAQTVASCFLAEVVSHHDFQQPSSVIETPGSKEASGKS